jgi:hypothetical protein
MMSRSSVLAAVAIVAGLGVGFASGWGVRGARANRELRQVVLVNQLERIGLSADALRSLQAGHSDRLNNLLWFGISSGLAAAEREVGDGAHLPAQPALPSLRASVERAQDVAQASSRDDLAQRLGALQARLGWVR